MFTADVGPPETLRVPWRVRAVQSTAERGAGMAVQVRLDDNDDIDAICLTHLDRDHFNPNWIDTLCRKRINVYVHNHHVHGLYRRDGARLLHRAGLLHVVNGQGFEPAPGVRAHTIGLPHDRTGTVGYLIETPSVRVGYATDLGSVPDELIDRFAGVDMLAIESNYDERMQQASPRPPMLKRRIMGPAGHLSNEQAFEAVRRITDACPRGGPGHIVLLHRSRQCNCPTIVRRVFEQDGRVAGRLTLTEQQQASAWLAVGE